MEKASDVPAVGKIFGLGVSGYLGSAIEIEAVAFPAREAGKGYYRFNDTAGSMAKDSMFNAAAVVRSVTGKELSDYDVNINFVGGGNIFLKTMGRIFRSTIWIWIYAAPKRFRTY